MYTVIPCMNVHSNTVGTMELSCLEHMTILYNFLDSFDSSKLYSNITVTRENFRVILYMNVHSNTVDTADLSCLEHMTTLWNFLDSLHSRKFHSNITVTPEIYHSNTVYECTQSYCGYRRLFLPRAHDCTVDFFLTCPSENFTVILL